MRVSAVDDQMGHAVSKRVCLARASPGDDEQRPSNVGAAVFNTMLDRTALRTVEGV